LRAKGHSDTDLAGAACDGVGDEAVGSDGGEKHGERCKECGESSDEALRGDGTVDLCGKGLGINAKCDE